jgi:lambda family phage portal protein
MVVVNTGPGEAVDFYDTKRPNVNAEPFVEAQLRRAAAGFGLGYSSLSRNYNGTYSAQRQELIENRPHFEAGTCVLIAQFARPTYQAFADAVAILDGVPRDVDLDSLHDADFMGPPLLWIDPEKEANAALMMTQAAFRSSASVIRDRGGSLNETYQQIAREQQMRQDKGINSTVDAGPVSPAKPLEAPPPKGDTKPSGNVIPYRS